MSILINILLVIHVLISLLIILLVLMQRPKNEGLGAAFGGGMTDNLFGAQTTNVLQSGTRWLGGIFFALTLLLSFLYVRNSSAKSSVQKSLSHSDAPAATSAPVAPSLPAVVQDLKPENNKKEEVEQGKDKKEGAEQGKDGAAPDAAKPPESKNPPEKPAPPSSEPAKTDPPAPAPAGEKTPPEPAK